MLDPDATRGTATHVPPPAAAGGTWASPHALQILTTEHWSLLAARSLGYTEAMSRATIYVAALTGSVVALALVGQATDFDDAFTAFALVLLPVVFFLGAVTIARLAQVNWEDAYWVQGMNRIRNAYLDLAPELEPYFVTSKYDDDRGVLTSTLGVSKIVPGVQAFVAIPGVVAVLDSVVAGAIAGIAARSLESGTGLALAVGTVAFLVALVAFAAFALMMIGTLRRRIVVRFPSPPDVAGARPLTADYPHRMSTSAVPAPLAQLPNALTVLRLVLVPVFVAVFLAAGDGSSWAAGMIFLVAGLTDQLDGFLARRWRVESRFGRLADPLADRLMIDAAAILLAFEGKLPWWAAALIVGRDVLLVGGYKLLMPPDYELEVSTLGKAATWLLYLAVGLLIVVAESTTWPLWLFYVALGLALVAAVQYVVAARREVRA